MFRELTSDELSCVAGGFDEGSAPCDAPFMPYWLQRFLYEDLYGGDCGVDGTDIGGGYELVRTADGHFDLYKDNQFVEHVQITSVTANDGSAEIGVSGSRTGGEFTFNGNDNTTITMVPVPH